MERYQSKVVVFLVLTREFDNKIQILLQRRCNTGYMDGLYDMASSGHLESNETLTDAVVREAYEELGLSVSKQDLELLSVIHPYQENYLRFFFKAKDYKGEPKIKEPNKCDDLSWFDIDNLPDNTIECIRNVIINIKNNILYDDGDFSVQKSIL